MCIVCHGEDTSYNDKYDLLICGSCGFVWQPIIGPQDLIEYAEEYHEKYSQYPLMRMSNLRADFIEKFVHGEVDSVLDVGFGTGDFLKVMKERKYEIFGLEVNEESWKHGLGWVHPYAGEKVGIATFYDSLEHIPNIVEVLGSINTKYLFVSIPNFKGMDSIEGWRHYRPGEHIYYFNLITLNRFINRFGYELIASDFPEDEIRNTEDKNILTAVFKRVRSSN